MAINERVITGTTDTAAADAGNAGTEGLILHLDANDVDSYDGDGTEWVDISNHEYTPTTDVSEHFNTVIWTGDGATSRNITGLGFDPDLVWIKKRTNDTKSHRLFNTVRGANKVLYSNSTAAEGSPTTELTAFITDGFTLGNQSAVNDGAAGDTYVAWCFKAGGAPTATNSGGQTPTSGSKIVDGSAVTDNYPTSSIYPKKQTVNTKLGFSITNYTGNLSSVQTKANSQSVPHGLDVPVEMIIWKRTQGGSWNIWHKALGNENKVLAFTTGDTLDYSTLYPTQPHDANHFYTNYVTASNVNSGNHIAYCFASKRGVSKIGSYTGTGAAGNKIYTGFEPAFVMIKSSSYTENWVIYDNKRSPSNPLNEILLPNSNSTELSSSNYNIQFNRDGFTLDTTQNFANRSNEKYIYLAFAKNTNETDLIDDTDLEQHLDPADSSSYSGTGTTWSDLANSNNATVVASTYNQEVGNFFELNTTTTDDISSTYATTFNSGVWSLEFWGSVNISDATFRYFMQGSNTAPYGPIVMLHRNTNLYVGIMNTASGYYGTQGYFNGTVKVGKWNHYVITFNKDDYLKVYINGELQGSGTNNFAGTYQTNRTGWKFLGQGNFKLGQMRLYSTILDEADIRQNFNFTKNNYPNGFNGTLTNMTSSDWNSSGYFTFSANNDTVNTSLIQNTSKAFSWSCWVRPDGTQPSYGTIMDNMTSSATYKGVTLMIISGEYVLALGGSSGNLTYTGTSATDNVWAHLVATFDGSGNWNFYVNNTQILTTDKSHNINLDSGLSIQLGNARYSGWDSFRGDISDVKVFDKALTDAEVTTQYNIGYDGIG